VPKDSTAALLKAVGTRVRDARRVAGFTQETAAARAGIDYKRYQRIEQGTVNVTVKTLARVAEALGTDLWTMLGQHR